MVERNICTDFSNYCTVFFGESDMRISKMEVCFIIEIYLLSAAVNVDYRVAAT